MGNTILYNTAGSIALAVNYVLQGAYSDKFMTKEGNKIVRINSEFFVRVDDAVFSIEDDVNIDEDDLDTGSSFGAGTTYYIYACQPLDGTQTPQFKISANATYPSGGWDASNSRKIGGFDTDGSGYVDESTLWDLRTVDIGGAATTDHKATHVKDGSDEINGDKLDIDYTPANYTPDTTPTEADDADHLAAHLAGISNRLQLKPLEFARGIHLTDAASGSNGIQVIDDDNIDFGTGDFSFLWKGTIPDYTPSAAQCICYKWQGSPVYAGWLLYFISTGVIRLKFGDGTSGTVDYDSTVAANITNGTAVLIGVSITRETASDDGSIEFYVNGIQLGAAVPISAASPVTVSNDNSLYIQGSNIARIKGDVNFSATFNRALSAAEHLSLFRNGIDFADKWGSQTILNVSTLVNSSVSPYDTFDGASATGFHAVTDGSAIAIAGTTDEISAVNGKKYILEFDLTLASGIGPDVALTDYLEGSRIQDESATTATDGHNKIVINCNSDTTGTVRFYSPSARSNEFTVTNFSVKRAGATIALEPEGIQPAPGQWLDSSSNKLHAMQPSAGSSLMRRQKTFEVRWTNIWAGTHEAQYICGVNQNVLPSDNVRIESITAIATAGGVNIIIGNGADNDRFVESTALSSGFNDFTVANRNHDGTNWKLVIDPAANLTGSITTTIKGIILD